MVKRVILFSCFMLFCVMVLIQCTSSNQNTTLDGTNLVNERCGVCHTQDKVTAAAHSLEEWTVIVERMISKGAILSGQEKQVLIEYLAATYPQ